MVLNVFRKNQFLRSLLLLPLTMLLHADLFVMLAPLTPVFHGDIDPFFHEMQTSYPVLHWLLYSILIFLSASILNRIAIIHRLANKPTLFPGLFFVVLMSIWPSFTGLSTMTLAIPVILLIISNLLYTHAESRQVARLFNVGLYSGLLVCLAAPFIYVLLPILMSVSILSSVRWQRVLNILNGLVLPPFMLFFYMTVFHDKPGYVWDIWSQQFDWASAIPLFSQDDWIVLASLILLFVFIVLSYAGTTSRKGIHVIRKIASMTWFMVLAVILYMASGAVSFHPFVLMIPMSAYFVAEGVLRFRHAASAEFVFVTMLILSAVLPFV